MVVPRYYLTALKMDFSVLKRSWKGEYLITHNTSLLYYHYKMSLVMVMVVIVVVWMVGVIHIAVYSV